MLPLNFNHFYYFYEVARHGSFTAAARGLMVSQSTLSIQVKQFETDMGVMLFERRKGGVDLTEPGAEAFLVAERVFGDIDRLRALLQATESQIAGLVSIGTVNSIGIYLLPPILTRFKDAFPDVQVKIDFKESEDVMDLLYGGKVDMAIVPWNRNYSDLEAIKLTQNKMFLVAPPDHPLASSDDVSPRDLEKYPFVGYAQGMHTRTLMDSLFRRMAISLEYTIESANSATIKHMVMAGMGLAVLPEIAVASELRHGQLVRIPVPTLVMAQEVMLYHRSKRTLSPTRRQFIEFLRDSLAPPTGRRPRTTEK